ncbi:MAG TPA: HD domain-containing protein [Patescibacteria group bacterium]|nr:HD domain-containing protein [Patescibacteria group bacterium]
MVNGSEKSEVDFSTLVAEYQTWTQLPPIAIESIVIPSGLLQKWTKEEFVTQISQYGTQTPEEVRERELALNGVVEYADEKFKDSNKQRRDTGEDRIYHALRMAYLLVSSGVMDLTVLKACILHDVPEDTGVSLSEITARFGERVATLVDLVTKVELNGTKKKHGFPEDKDKRTLEKFFEALDISYQAMYIKLADAADNSETYDVYEPEKAIYKAGLALKYYEPLARDLGLKGIANIIGDNAFKIVNPKAYEAVMAMRDELKTEDMVSELNGTVSSWMEDLDRLHSELHFESIMIRLPGIYEAYRMSAKSGISKDDVIPRMEIMCSNWFQAMAWDAFLYDHMFLTEAETPKSSERIDRRLAADRPVTEIMRMHLLEKDMLIPVVLMTANAAIMPVDLDTNQDLSGPQKQRANDLLNRLKKNYQEASKGKGDKTTRMAEKLGKEAQVTVRVDNGKEYEFTEKEPTVLDLAYQIGANLGNNAFGAQVWRGVADDQRLQLSDVLIDRDIVHINADKKGGVRITRVRPERFDWVVTNKAAEDIKAELNRILNDQSISHELKNEIRNAARTRGVDIMRWLYKMKRNKPLDIGWMYGFKEDRYLENQYENTDALLEKLGFISISRPLNRTHYQEKYSKWKDVAVQDHFDPESHITKETQLLTFEALRFADNLIAFRKTRPSLHIHIYEDSVGYIERISNIVGVYGINMLPIHGQPDLYSRGSASIIDICLVDGDIKDKNVKNLLGELELILGKKGKAEIIKPET